MGYRMTNIEIELYFLKFSFFLSVSALLLYWRVRSVTNIVMYGSVVGSNVYIVTVT
jgi:hypothetical protein